MLERNDKCPLPAFARYTWPGMDESLACIQHSMAISNVARAMGLSLQMIQVSQSDQEHCLMCQSANDLPGKILE